MNTAGRTPGIELLLDLTRTRRRGSRSWVGICPVHNDHRPSLSIDYKIGRHGVWTTLVYCTACGAGLKEVCAALGLEQWRVLSFNYGYENLDETPRRAAPLPSLKMLERWQQCLARSPSAQDYLTHSRGLTDRTIKRYRLGLDGDTFVLPVFERGRCSNIRRYRTHPAPGEPKIRGLAGRGSQLYPTVPHAGELLIVEGEWDALVGRSHGLRTVTSTAGAFGWNERQVARLRNRDVVLAFDCDEHGRAGAERLADLLVGVAATVRVIDLGLGDGEDLTDWFVALGRTREGLLSRISRAAFRNQTARNE